MTENQLSRELSKTALRISDQQFIIDLIQLVREEKQTVAGLFWARRDQQSVDYINERLE